MASDSHTLLAELLEIWESSTPRSAPTAEDPFTSYEPTVPAVVRATTAVDLGSELGEQLVSEVLKGVRAGHRGIFVTEPERLRTAIFLRGYTLGRFARFAGMAPSTLSRALAGLPVAPSSWQALVTALLHA